MNGPVAMLGPIHARMRRPSELELCRSPLQFFGRVFALSVPFWWIGGATGLELMPGLSVSELMTFCPMIAALMLVHRERRWAAMVVVLWGPRSLTRFRLH
jgi:hypothetical protein